MVCGKNLVCLANVFALAIAEGLSADELDVMGALLRLSATSSPCTPSALPTQGAERLHAAPAFMRGSVHIHT
jgi:hypothetical protein